MKKYRILVLFLFLLQPWYVGNMPAFSNPSQVSVVTYDELVTAIRQTRVQSRERVEQAVEQEKVREAWETGKLIDKHVLSHKERADYGKQVLARLSKDLDTSSTELYLMLEFSRTYPIFPAPGKLSWAHYRELLVINDEVQRKEIAEHAIHEGWSHKRTREEVRRVQHRAVAPASLGHVQPGRLYAYRVLKAKAGHLRGQLVLDLGFANYYGFDELTLPSGVEGQPEGIKKFREGDTVLLEKGKLKKVETSDENLWTYQAYVTQVIDGDTFDAVIDLGFKISTLQRLRLRGIDAREVQSAEGLEAKKFLEKKLKNSPVLIRAVKSDKYDRYLADVFANGQYVNQQLVDAGLATLVRD